MTDRLGAQLTSTISLAGLGLCFLLMRLALDAEVLVDFSFAFLSAIEQLFFPAQQIRLANEFSAGRGAILAWNNSALFLGISLGSLIGGQAISHGGLDMNLTISAAIAIAGLTISLGGRPQVRSVIRLASLSVITQDGPSHRPSGAPRVR
jgi:predicted MFS family arabinose efflux permease